MTLPVVACGPAVVKGPGRASGWPVVRVVRVTGSVQLDGWLSVAGLLVLLQAPVASVRQDVRLRGMGPWTIRAGRLPRFLGRASGRRLSCARRRVGAGPVPGWRVLASLAGSLGQVRVLLPPRFRPGSLVSGRRRRLLVSRTWLVGGTRLLPSIGCVAGAAAQVGAHAATAPRAWLRVFTAPAFPLRTLFPSSRITAPSPCRFSHCGAASD